MKKSFYCILLLLAFVIGFAWGNARFYDGLNSGVVWDFGGIEIKPAPAVFLCEASGHMYKGNWVEDWVNPIAPLFPDLVTDC